MSDQNPHTVCIIGGGMSGLFTGALLAKNGYQVTVLEKNHIIGGGLQSFRRGDAVFNTGMQFFCGYERPFMLGHLFDYLDISKENVQIVSTDPHAQEKIWLDPNHCYCLPKSRQAYEQYLISCFPHEAKGILAFINDIYTIGQTFDYFWLRPRKNHPEAIPFSQMTAKELLEKYISDNNLKRIFEYIGLHVGYNLSNIPAIELGMLLNLYIEGSWRISGGNCSLALELARRIESAGGQVLNNAIVNKVHVDERKVVYVETEHGLQYTADIFISSITPKLLVRIADGEIYRQSTRERVESFKNDSSGYLLSIKLKPNSIKFLPHWIFLPVVKDDNKLPFYISLLTPPRINQDEWADTMEILSFDYYNSCMEWEKTFIGERGKEYENFKLQKANQILEQVSRYYPRITKSIESLYIGTPLTVRDYYGNVDGAAYSQQGLFIPIRTRINNLFITGQAVQYQGLFGVATTAIVTAETILGKSLIEEIAKA